MRPLTLTCALILCTLTAAAQGSLRQSVERWVAANQQRIVRLLVELLAIPNVSADRPTIRRNAEWLRGMLEARGFEAELLETPGNPLVYGERRVPGAARTLLLYCQYDGQPVDPKQWKQPTPFTPVLRTGRMDAGAREMPDPGSQAAYERDWRIYARSASDAKAPIVALLAALDALAAQGLAPTSNLRVIMDGEEEISSPNLVPAIAAHRDRLAADLMLVLDGPQHFDNQPTLVFGARGIVAGEITVFGPKSGLHSGNYGNWAPNPAWRLAHLLASMRDEDGKVLIDGFYDGIPPLTDEEREMVAAIPDESPRLLKVFGLARPEVPGRSLQEGFQWPSLNVRGLTSAFTGAGARTIIPDRATAALDIRLVKETPAAAMRDKLVAHVRKQGYHLVDGEPDDATRAQHAKIARIDMERGTQAFRTSTAIPESRAVIDALTRVWGRPPVRVRTAGGTVPIAQFIDALGFPAILVPTVNFDNNQHEENENVRLGNLFDGIVTVAALLRMP